MKMSSNGRPPQDILSGVSNDSYFILFIGNPNGKPKVNLECGPAQPSLYLDISI
jgi:hypothetical protein